MRKVFGIGLSRTGTASLSEALGCLGYRTLHYPTDPTTRREVLDFDSGRLDALHLSALEASDALTDLPAPWAYPALDRAYPGSAFILTVRDKASWLESCARHWEMRGVFKAVGAPADSYWAFVDFLRRRMYGIPHFDPAVFADVYDRHHEAALAYFANRPADLLVLNISAGEGWASLCRFLDAPVPDRPFPWVNRSQ
jgi:hypothetical protein